jgi:hypothetical protein
MSEDVRNSVALGIMMMGMYIQRVIEDQGIEKALEYHKKNGYIMGSRTAASLKKELGDSPTPEGLKKALEDTYSNFGMDMKITTNPDGIDLLVNKCTFYQGYSMSGMDHDTIIKFCHAAGSGEFAAMKEAYPQLEPFSTPRSSADGVCIEGYKIKK